MPPHPQTANNGYEQQALATCFYCQSNSYNNCFELGGTLTNMWCPLHGIQYRHYTKAWYNIIYFGELLFAINAVVFSETVKLWSPLYQECENFILKLLIYKNSHQISWQSLNFISISDAFTHFRCIISCAIVVFFCDVIKLIAFSGAIHDMTIA